MKVLVTVKNMRTKICALRKSMQKLFVLCCFVIGGCGASPRSVETTPAVLREESVRPLNSAMARQNELISPSSAVDQSINPFDSVATRFDAFIDWHKNCFHKPQQCELEEFITSGTPFSDNFSQIIARNQKHNIYSQPGRGERKYFVNSISNDPTTMTATVSGCVYDTVILFLDGFIFDDKVSSSLATWQFSWQDNRWSWVDFQTYKKLYNVNICEG